MVSNYDRFPRIEVDGVDCAEGWEWVRKRIWEKLSSGNEAATVCTVECYVGSDIEEIASGLAPLGFAEVIFSADAFLGAGEIESRMEPFLGGDDPVFGWMTSLRMDDLMDEALVDRARGRIGSAEGNVLIIGPGAALIHPGDLLVYADLARWEAQLRMRRGEFANLGTGNHGLKWSLQYKRAFFIDWRICDRLKRDLMHRWDMVLDTNRRESPVIAPGDGIRDAMRAVCKRPFRVVPFFDPAPWGGQWMKEAFGLDPEAENYGWGFDCVPEENSLLLDLGDAVMELPSINLVFQEPRALLGERVHARFGDEFPIRFDFLDTIGGGHLSFQVHPLTEYIQHHFGMPYTQDESYYIMQADGDATVYIGTIDGVDREAMAAELRAAQAGEGMFDADRHINRIPARKHDHFLIPAGTCHCSGKGSLVLEISASPYIFTFKMWDWGRLGLDGLPRPINVERGLANINWSRDASYAARHLVNAVEETVTGAGWREERTGLHQREFIETRRHWFTGTVPHHTGGGVNVLNLIEGEEAVVESPGGAFEPFVVHYAETFIVPAAVGAYTIRPCGKSAGKECATIKAYVRS